MADKMSWKNPDAFLFDVDDWLTSSKISLMPPACEGGYIRALCYMWRSGDCSLPDDDEKMAVLCRLDKGGYTLVKNCLEPHPEKPGYLTNLRLLSEWKKLQKWREKSVAGGKKSAEKRWGDKGGYKMVTTKSKPKRNQSVRGVRSIVSIEEEETIVPSSPPHTPPESPPPSPPEEPTENTKAKLARVEAITFESFTPDWLQQHGFTQGQVEYELDRIKDYFRSNTKRLHKYTDYVAFSRNWIKDNQKGNHHENHGNSGNFRGQGAVGRTGAGHGTAAPSNTDKRLAALYQGAPKPE